MGFSEGVLPQPKAQHSQNTGFAEGRPPPPPYLTIPWGGGGGGGADTPDAGPDMVVARAKAGSKHRLFTLSPSAWQPYVGKKIRDKNVLSFSSLSP